MISKYGIAIEHMKKKELFLNRQYHSFCICEADNIIYCCRARNCNCNVSVSVMLAQMKYPDAELARVSVLTLDVTKTAYVSPVASVWQVS